MTKYTVDDVSKIAEKLQIAKARDRAAHFLIGAGCLISAGIPGAPDLVKRIHSDFPKHCDALIGDDRNAYGKCMALLTINERRDLIKPYLENAKINWGHIALAQLIAEGFVSRVLTVNFDLVPENACGILGLQPAVYDFGVAPASDAAMIVSPAIVHLHGQSYGLVLLNTEEETKRHREKLRPILTDTLRNAPLVVIGYSGSADGVFQTLVDDFEGRESLYWIAYSSEPGTHIRALIDKEHASFLAEGDFDRFMIDLAQAVGCWPPPLFSNPLDQLLRELTPIVPYPVGDTSGEIDLVTVLRGKLSHWREEMSKSERKFAPIREAFMTGAYDTAITHFSNLTDRERESLPSEESDIAAWSFIMSGNVLFSQAEQASGEEAARLFAAAGEKYERSLAIKPDKHEALNNWGNVLLAQAKLASGEEAARLFAAGAEKFERCSPSSPIGMRC